jgi:hypothetical protein
VKAVHIERSMPDELKILMDFYKMSYMATFGTSDVSNEDYADGEKMLKDWYERMDFTQFRVVTCESKESFPIPTSIGDIPFNYIWDRHDQLEESVYRVVDYKTNRWAINHEQLRKKVQARAYGLAAQIKYPQATRIIVEFDMLRHGGGVGIAFSRDDNIATWNFMKEEAERIIATPSNNPPETLNPECVFCVRKVSCNALKKNISVGGIMSLTDPAEMIDTRAQLEYQKKALQSTIDQIDEVILGQARAMDVFEFESDLFTMGFGVRSTRSIDAERAEHVLGPVLSKRFMGRTLKISDVDKLLKGDELDESQKHQLASLIYFKQGEPSIKITPKNPIDGS